MVYRFVQKHGADDDARFARQIENARKQFEIPDDVYVWDSEDGNGYKWSITKQLNSWVRGKMSPDQAHELMWTMEECYEFDWGWVFFETPLFYQGARRTEKEAEEALDRALINFYVIGTRNHELRITETAYRQKQIDLWNLGKEAIKASGDKGKEWHYQEMARRVNFHSKRMPS